MIDRNSSQSSLFNVYKCLQLSCYIGWQRFYIAISAGSIPIIFKLTVYSPEIFDPRSTNSEFESMKSNIINVEQFEYWNNKSGQKWVKLDDSLNERFSTLTDELFQRAAVNENDNVLDIGCGGGETSFRALQLVGNAGYVLGADISKTLLNLARMHLFKI